MDTRGAGKCETDEERKEEQEKNPPRGEQVPGYHHGQQDPGGGTKWKVDSGGVTLSDHEMKRKGGRTRRISI